MIQHVVNIKNHLPHRPPMLMVDDVTAISDNEVQTAFHIAKDNIFVENNTFKEAGLIENAAQTCSTIVAQPYFANKKDLDRENMKVIGFISTIKNLKVHHLPEAESTIETRAVLGSRYDTDEYALCTMLCSTYQQEKLLFEAEINLFVQQEE